MGYLECIWRYHPMQHFVPIVRPTPQSIQEHYWNDLSACYMTVPVAKGVLMKQESSCLFIEAEQLVVYPLHRLHALIQHIKRAAYKAAWSLLSPKDDSSSRASISE